MDLNTRNNPITNSPYIILLLPLIHGLGVYFMILIFFSGPEEIKNAFSSNEFLVPVIASLISFHTGRYWYIKSPWKKGSKKFITFLTGTLIWIIGAIIPVIFYFNYILGYTSYKSELNIFIAIYSISGLIYYLTCDAFRMHEEQLSMQFKQHEEIRNNYLLEVQNFMSNINTGFLNESLENIILQSRTNKGNIQKSIQLISEIYRGILNTKFEELIKLDEELQKIHKLTELETIKSKNVIEIESAILKPEQFLIIPNSLFKLIYNVLRNSLDTPRKIKLGIQQNSILWLQIQRCESLVQHQDFNILWDEIKKSFSVYFSIEANYNSCDEFVEFYLPLYKADNIIHS